MPTFNQPKSMDLETRYSTTRVTSAGIDIKQRLKPAGKSPEHGDRMPINSIQEKTYTVPDFNVKPILGVTELLDADESNMMPTAKSKQISRYAKGLNTKRYHH